MFEVVRCVNSRLYHKVYVLVQYYYSRHIGQTVIIPVILYASHPHTHIIDEQTKPHDFQKIITKNS